MRRILTTAIAVLFVAVAFAGCTGGTNPTAGTPTGGTPAGGPPQAIVQTSTLSPVVGEPVTFDALQSAAGDSANWTFGDGQTGSGSKVSHTYTVPGQYIVGLTVTNAKGSANNQAVPTYLRVAAAPGSETDASAVAALVIDRQIISPGGNVTVNASSSYGRVANPDFDEAVGVTPGNPRFVKDDDATANLTFSLDWGDGSAAVAASSGSHVYATAGSYVVTVTVTSGTLASKQGATVLVLTNPPPVGGYKNKDLFVTAMISGPQSFDPAFDYESAGGMVINQVYDSLFNSDRGNTEKIVAELAAEVPTIENGGIKDGGKVYVIKLRQGVKFHDGTEFDASAVKFSLDRTILMNDPSSASSVISALILGGDEFRLAADYSTAARQAYLAKEGVKVLDKYTVQITLPQPNPAFFQRIMFYSGSIVSPTAVKACHQERVALWGVCQTPDGLPPAAAAGGTAVTRDPWMDTNAVGTGPFKLRKWLPGDRVILDRNDDYHGEKAKLKTVIIQYVDDLNTRILMLRNGDADEIYIASSDLDRVRPSIEDIARFTAADTLIVDEIFFNYDVEDPAECPVVAGTPDCKFFQDIHVRKAFSHAFDYDTFLKDVWKGRAKPIAGVIPRGMPGYDEALKPIATDTTLAKSELAQSKGKDGFSLTCYYNSGNNVRKGACELLKKNLEALDPGKITIGVRELPFNTILDKTQNQQLALWVLGWSPDWLGTDNYILNFYQSKGNYPVNQNFKDEELDAKIAAALAELDPVKQAPLWAEINKLGVEKYVSMWLDQRTQTHVERTYVTGYYYSPLHSGSPNVGDYSTLAKV